MPRQPLPKTTGFRTARGETAQQQGETKQMLFSHANAQPQMISGFTSIYHRLLEPSSNPVKTKVSADLCPADHQKHIGSHGLQETCGPDQPSSPSWKLLSGIRLIDHNSLPNVFTASALHGGQLCLRMLLRMTRTGIQHGSSVTSRGYRLQDGTVRAWTCSARTHSSAVLKQVIELKQRLAQIAFLVVKANPYILFPNQVPGAGLEQP